jgi:hypothetical protein
MNLRIKKQLTLNDTGENGSHQAGLCIPKNNDYLNFFPPLDSKIKNPFAWININDESNNVWKFKFIYYNNKLTSNGTRNEYRLTCMTKYLKKQNAREGDVVIFEKINNTYFVRFESKGLKISSHSIWEVEFL